MGYVFKLGPQQTAQGSFSTLIHLGDGRLDAAANADDLEALRELRSRSGATLTCERKLGPAAATLGLATGPFPPEALALRAGLAVGLSHGPLLAGVKDPGLLLELIDAAGAFERAEPWEHFLPDETLDIEVKDALTRSFEACVMGQGGETFGLAMYFEHGSIERLRATPDPEDARALECMSLLIEPEPEYVAEAVEALGHRKFAPSLMRLKRGDLRPCTMGEVAELIAALRAVTDLARGASVGRGTTRQVKPLASASARRRTHPFERSPEPAEAKGLDDYAQVGRNEPCPCGSGKKFKKCHLERWTEAPAPPRVEPAHERERRLASDILEFGRRRFGAHRVGELLAQPFGDRTLPPQLAPVLAAYETPIDGRPLAAHFLAERGEGMPALDRRWVEAQLATPLCLWEVLRVEKERGLELVDLLAGRRVFVEEVRGSRALSPRMALLGRVMEFDGVARLYGIHDQPLVAKEVRPVFLSLREPAGRWHDERSRTPHLLSSWDAAVSEMALKAASPMKLTNTDGETVVFVEERFKLRRGAKDAVVSRLMGIEGTLLEEDTAKECAVTFTKPGNAVHRSWKQTCIGSARVTRSKLTLSANSRERADRLRDLVARELAALVTHAGREEKPPPERRGGENLAIDAQPLAGPPDPEALVRQHLRGWLDEPLPALNGLSPRKAAGSPAERESLHWLLKELEGVDPERAADGAHLRRLVGLDELGQPLKDHELDLALGSGKKISESLLDFALPLLQQLPPGDETAVRSALQTAALAWNAAIEEAVSGSKAIFGEARRQLSRLSDPRALEVFEGLVARKRELFGGDLRLIGDFSLSREAGKVNVRAEGRLPAAIAERARAAGLVK